MTSDAKGVGPAGRDLAPGRKTIRSFTATRQDLEMLEAIARYHGFSKSGTITSLVRKEFWRLFPGGTSAVKPDRGARVTGRHHAG
jgi:hypothetical protein